jgi:CRP-like cAMP-binding protein
MLMKEGDPGDSFSVLAKGDVKITKQGKLLNILSAGECIGEMAYLTPQNGTRGADVSALGEGTLITINTETITHASQATRGGFDRAFLRILVERLNLANTRLTSAAL